VVHFIFLMFDRRLVGDNNNKVAAPNMIIYRFLLLKTPTRAVHTNRSKNLTGSDDDCYRR